MKSIKVESSPLVALDHQPPQITHYLQSSSPGALALIENSSDSTLVSVKPVPENRDHNNYILRSDDV